MCRSILARACNIHKWSRRRGLRFVPAEPTQVGVGGDGSFSVAATARLARGDAPYTRPLPGAKRRIVCESAWHLPLVPSPNPGMGRGFALSCPLSQTTAPGLRLLVVGCDSRVVPQAVNRRSPGRVCGHTARRSVACAALALFCNLRRRLAGRPRRNLIRWCGSREPKTSCRVFMYV